MGCGASHGGSAVHSSSATTMDKPAAQSQAPLKAQGQATPSKTQQGHTSRKSATREHKRPADKVGEEDAEEVFQGASAGVVYDKYSVNKTIGTGGYAVVRLAKHLETGALVAIKIMRLPSVSTAKNGTQEKRKEGTTKVQKLKNVCREINILRKLKHPSILPLYEFFLNASYTRIYLVMQYLKGGDVLSAVKKKGKYTESDARTIFVPVLEGLRYLHEEANIIHRDLKLENILLEDSDDLGSVKIADFGLAKAIQDSGDDLENIRQTICGTPLYLAPEMVQGKDYTSKVDIWSAGVLLYILMSGTVPFIDENQQQLFRKIAEAKYVLEGDDWDHVSDDAKLMIRNIMHKDPNQRLSAAQALKLPWVGRPHEELDKHHMPDVQERLDLYASKMKLPISIFEPRTLIIRQGERATEVYLIRKGEVEVFFEETDQNGDIVKETRVAVRGEGDFVGEMGVIVNEKGDMLLHRAATFREGHSTRRLIVPPQASRKVEHVNSEGTMSNDELADDAKLLMMAKKSARRWVGARRSASVRCLTQVEAIVLQRSQMQWVLENDEEVAGLLISGISRRMTELKSVRHHDDPMDGEDGTSTSGAHAAGSV